MSNHNCNQDNFFLASLSLVYFLGMKNGIIINAKRMICPMK